MRPISRLAWATFGVFVFTSVSCAEEWGTLTGTLVFGGDAPTAPALNITKDKEVCTKTPLFSESLVVNPENKGIKDVVVYLYTKKGTDVPVHESYTDSAAAEVAMDNMSCRFEPHVTLLRTSQTLLIGNKDPIGHNTKIDASKNVAVNDTIPANGSSKKQFPEAERLPVRVSCSIHPWMQGWLLVKDNPYFAVSDDNGKFEIQNLPVGKWTFQFWHEQPGYVREAKKGGAKESWKKGRVEIEVKAGDNDLGTIEIPASALEG